MGKDLTEVRSPQRKLMPDTVGLEQHKPTSLRGIAEKAKADKQHRFRDLYRELNAAANYRDSILNLEKKMPVSEIRDRLMLLVRQVATSPRPHSSRSAPYPP
jgi:translation initiation factor 2 beta subunit (eIF-2beta)/eIF-5